MTATANKLKVKTNKFKRVKTPTVLQMEAVESGAAALGIILGYHKRIIPLAELRVACGVSRDGSKATNIVKAARNYGMEAKGHKKQVPNLMALRPPFIVPWNFNHFLVVEGFGKDGVYLNDPATGPRTISLEEFDRSYTGLVLVMEPGPQFQPGGRQPSIVGALRDRLQGSTGALLYCLLAGFLLVIPGLAIPVFSQVYVDNILLAQRENWLRPLILGLSVTTVLQGLLTLLQRRYLRLLKIKLSAGMSSRFIWHILQLPVSFYAQRFAGEVSNRIRINDKVARVLSGQLITTAIDSVMVLFYALVMLAYDWLLTLLAIGFSLINILVLQWISRDRVNANMRLGVDMGKASGVAIAGLQGMETIKASALESDFFARWAGYYTKAVNAQQELGIANQALGLLPTLLTSLTIMLILVIGGLRVMGGHLTIGMLVAFQSLMASFQRPVNTLINFGSTLQELEGDLKRLDDVLRNQIDPDLQQQNHSNMASLETVRLEGYVELRNITFGYSRVEAPLITNFNCTLKPGQRIALVGGSGSGKSTIAKLITGLYQPWSGEILLDGTARKEIPRPVLANSLAMVEQDIFLFGGTLRDNLTLWDSTIPDEQLIQACRDAAIYDVVRGIPNGFDGELLEGGSNLSGGQRQRLEIARALVNDPAILVMDEATSALDAETERIIDENLRRRGCTCIIVAHRLSTIRDCDEIIVLEQGKVVQRGDHEELWHVDDGAYARLIRSEAGAI